MRSFFARSYSIVWMFIGLFVLVAVLSWAGNGAYVTDALKLNPQAIRQGQAWRLLTYAFLSVDGWDLFMKMLLLFFIAVPLEAVWGTQRFLSLMLCTIVGGGLFAALLQQEMVGTWAPMMALLLVHGFMFPESVMYLFFVIPMRVKTFSLIAGGLFVALSAAEGLHGLAQCLALGCGMLYYVALTATIPWMRKARKPALAVVGVPFKRAPSDSPDKMTRVRAIYEAVNAGRAPSAEEMEFIAQIAKEADAAQGICSPLSFCMDNTICPPCAQIGLCLRRYCEQPAETEETAETA